MLVLNMTNNHLGIIQYINVHNIYYTTRQTHFLLRDKKYILHLNSFHFDAPVVSCFIQNSLRIREELFK